MSLPGYVDIGVFARLIGCYWSFYEKYYCLAFAYRTNARSDQSKLLECQLIHDHSQSINPGV